MAINFNGIGPNQSGASNARDRDNVTSLNRGATNGKANGPQEAGNNDDSVKLSNQVQSLQSLEARVKEMPEVDTERVERIKSAIANGEYEINYDRLAAAIEKFEGEL